MGSKGSSAPAPSYDAPASSGMSDQIMMMMMQSMMSQGQSQSQPQMPMAPQMPQVATAPAPSVAADEGSVDWREVMADIESKTSADYNTEQDSSVTRMSTQTAIEDDEEETSLLTS